MGAIQEGFGPGSYSGPIPAAPTAPTTAANALPGAAPALALGTITITVAGDANVASTLPTAVVVRR